MATSGTTTFSITRDDIIKRALRMLGVLSQGQTPSATQYTESSFALNCLVKAYLAEGMPLWAMTTYVVSLTAGVNSYTIGPGQTINTPKPLKIIQAYNKDINSNVDIPIRIVSKQEYNLLGNKESSGNPIQIYYDPQRVYGVLHVFPTPTSVEQTNNRIYIVYQRPFEDIDSSADEPDFPQEWFDVLCYGLATRLAPEYGLPIEDRRALMQEYTMIKNDALSFGTEEGSMYFQVEYRGW